MYICVCMWDERERVCVCVWTCVHGLVICAYVSGFVVCVYVYDVYIYVGDRHGSLCVCVRMFVCLLVSMCAHV